MRVKIKRLDERARLPTRATDGSAGWDLYALDTVSVGTNLSKPLRTGIAMEIPPGWEGQIRPRSGLAAGLGLSVLNAPGTIDSDYRGEIKVLLYRAAGLGSHRVRKGDRIAQIVFQRVPEVELVEVAELDDTDRGNGGCGSTGR
jgi:dUTP pyrophosphatase